MIDEDSLMQGDWYEFYDDGNVREKATYKDGRKNGRFTRFYRNGNIELTASYKDGRIDGFYQAYYEMGEVKETGVWRKGRNTGILKHYYENGNISQIFSFNSEGKREGYQLYFHPNGIVSSFSMIYKGKKTEYTLAFDSLGRDTLVHYYDENSNLLYQAFGLDEVKKFKDETGLLDGIISYVNSQNDIVYKKQKAEQQRIQTKLEVEVQKTKLEHEKKTIYLQYIGILLLLLVVLLVFIAFRNKKKDNALISRQKEEVEAAHLELEVKNQEIIDSISYAKRIQSAILPPNKVIKEYLQESFVLYKPKDIVAGDFYWMEHQDNKVLFAVADCTGHGVPGAMVSVVCNNALNRSVREHRLTSPGEILSKTREIVVQEFEKSDENVKDGMDIAFCSLEGNQLQYAGAHNPLWIIRNGEIIETKANKQPIGQFDNPKPFTTHSFNLKRGDTLYIFSDGYVDQFGGEKNKKFKAKAFRQLLLSIQDKSMEKQKTIIDEAFVTWKGSLEQIDDVCVIGVRV